MIRLIARIAALATILGGAGAMTAGIVGYVLMRQSLTPLEGRIGVAGLTAEIELIRDSHGVAHLYAQSDDDAYFALGYIHAVDRLWQMDMARRTAQGRLAERFGERVIETDKFLRALDLDGYAARALPGLSERTRGVLGAYAAGVNARLAQIEEDGLGRGAPEFFLFGAQIDPWRPEDSIAVLKVMALQISMAGLVEDVRRGRALLTLSPAQVRDLYPTFPSMGVLSLPPYRGTSFTPRERGRDPLEVLGIGAPEMRPASNAWAVDGSRTATGAPLLASDPHLSLSAPGIIYPVGLNAPDLTLIGGSLPGVPAILFGRNSRVGWGLTATQLDDLDIFIERIDPQDPDRYVAPNGFLAFGTRRETIRVRGGKDIVLDMLSTRHGPVLPLNVAGLADVTPPGYVAALSWTALTEDDRSMDALVSLNHATSAPAAFRAARSSVAPSLNLIVADPRNIGMTVTGRVPLRRLGSRLQGRVPSPGDIDSHDWVDFLPGSEMPGVLNPPSGAVANANNKVGDQAFPRHLSFDFDAPYRIQRIIELLNGRPAHSAAGFEGFQSDVQSPSARVLVPLLGAEWWTAPPPNDAHPLRADALSQLREWDGGMRDHDAAPLIFTAWLDEAKRRVMADELGELAGAFAGPRPLFMERVFRNIEDAALWCDDISTGTRETCADVSQAALDAALAGLERRFGSDMAEWRWGIAHRAVHRHRPLGELSFNFLGFDVGPGLLLNVTQETAGGDDTLNRGVSSYLGAEPFANVHGAVYRGVYDFADLDRSSYIVSTGVSGHPLSPYYANLAPLWRRGDYMRMSTQREDVEAGAVERAVLVPRQDLADREP